MVLCRHICCVRSRSCRRSTTNARDIVVVGLLCCGELFFLALPGTDDPVSLLALEFDQLVSLHVLKFETTHDLVTLIVALGFNHDRPVLI